MKSNARPRRITKPLLKDLVERQKANSKLNPKQDPAVESKPLDPPDLYQDPGGGYNSDLVFPQE